MALQSTIFAGPFCSSLISWGREENHGKIGPWGGYPLDSQWGRYFQLESVKCHAVARMMCTLSFSSWKRMTQSTRTSQYHPWKRMTQPPRRLWIFVRSMLLGLCLRWCFFTDCTIVKHHQSTIWEHICLAFPSVLSKAKLRFVCFFSPTHPLRKMNSFGDWRIFFLRCGLKAMDNHDLLMGDTS